MINSIYSTSPSLRVDTTPAHNYVNAHSGSQGVGNMRYNTSNQSMEVYDGLNWVTLQMSHTGVGLSYEVEGLLSWVREKIKEELELEELAKTNTTVNDLVNQIKLKHEQIKMVQILLNSPGDVVKPSMVP